MQLKDYYFFSAAPDCAWKYCTFGGEIGGEISARAHALIIGALSDGLLELCSAIVVLYTEACSLCCVHKAAVSASSPMVGEPMLPDKLRSLRASLPRSPPASACFRI